MLHKAWVVCTAWKLRSGNREARPAFLQEAVQFGLALRSSEPSGSCRGQRIKIGMNASFADLTVPYRTRSEAHECNRGLVCVSRALLLIGRLCVQAQELHGQS